MLQSTGCFPNHNWFCHPWPPYWGIDNKCSMVTIKPSQFFADLYTSIYIFTVVILNAYTIVLLLNTSAQAVQIMSGVYTVINSTIITLIFM